MKKYRRNSKGITLIALVITIIILLILAGVSISALGGENGLISRAIQAATAYKKAQYFEEINLEIMEEQQERMSQEKEEPFIVSLKERIQQKNWTEENKVLIAKQNDSGYGSVEEGNEKDANILIVETKDGNEIIIDVSNVKKLATIRNTFEKSGKTYEVKYDGNGGTGDSPETQKIKSGFSLKLLSNTYSKTNYEFVGWCENKSGEGKVYNPNETYTPPKNTTLYAIWRQNTVTISFTANVEDATGSMDVITVEKGKETTLPANNFARTGYSFVKWNTSADGTGTDYANLAKLTTQNNITLYAIWEQNVVATLSINNNKKLTEGTTFTVSGTAYSSNIKKVEIIVGNQNVYTEEVENGGKTYSNTISVDNLKNLGSLTFNETYETKIKITSTTGISTEEKVAGLKNYIIGSATNLNQLATVVNSGATLSGETIYQVSNITTTENYIPIGYYDGTTSSDWTDIGPYFAGIYNGNNKSITITSMSEDTRYKSTGIFGFIMNSTVKNLTARGRNEAESIHAAGIVAGAYSSTIYNCINEANIKAYVYSGGICSRAVNNAQIKNCINKGYVGALGAGNGNFQVVNSSGTQNLSAAAIGGIVASIEENVNIENCINQGNVGDTYGFATNKNTAAVGGICGIMRSNSNIIKSKNIANLICSDGKTPNVSKGFGGIVAYCQDSKVEQCYNTGDIAKFGAYMPGFSGGIIAMCVASEIINCYNLRKYVCRRCYCRYCCIC